MTSGRQERSPLVHHFLGAQVPTLHLKPVIGNAKQEGPIRLPIRIDGSSRVYAHLNDNHHFSALIPGV